MGLDLTKLSAQGRAYSPGRCWTAEELEALLMFERERGLSRVAAADFVRNGIMTVEDYDKSQKKNFKPKTLERATAEAEVALKEEGKKVVKEEVKKTTIKSSKEK